MLKILLAGSSHTRLFFPHVKKLLKGQAEVTRLPHDAGRTDEILGTLHEWPVEDQDIVHLYAGHRDLIFDAEGQVFIGPGAFEANLIRIVQSVAGRTSARIVLSTIPPVSDGFLQMDSDRNSRIRYYNDIIESVAKRESITVHDFWDYVIHKGNRENAYSDGLHFSREFYLRFGETLAAFLIRLARDG